WKRKLLTAMEDPPSRVLALHHTSTVGSHQLRAACARRCLEGPGASVEHAFLDVPAGSIAIGKRGVGFARLHDALSHSLHSPASVVADDRLRSQVRNRNRAPPEQARVNFQRTLRGVFDAAGL